MRGHDAHTGRPRWADDTGAVAIVGAVFLVAALLAAALAVDIGNQIYNQRELRKVVDLAALDAIRAVGDRQGEVTNAQGEPLNDQEAAEKLARDSAIANGFDPDAPDEAFHVCIGVWDVDAGVFAPSEQCPQESRDRFGDPTAETPNAVGVAADDRVTFRFAGGDRQISADSIASLDRIGGIAAGSRLASVSAGAAAGDPDDEDELEDLRELIDPLIEELFGGDDYGLEASVLSYEWLASTSIRLGDLAAEMGFGSVDEMLDAEVTGDEVFAAMIATAEADGHTEGEAQETNDEIASAIAAGWTGETSFRLGDRMEASSATAADAEWNLMDLFLGTLQLANGDHLVDTDLDLGLDLDDVPLLDGQVTAGDLALVIIEPARSARGPVGIDVETAQIRARLDLDVDIAATIDGGEVRLEGTVPIHLDAARSTATLGAIGCGEPTLTMTDITTSGTRMWIADVEPGTGPDDSVDDHWASVGLEVDTDLLDDDLLDELGLLGAVIGGLTTVELDVGVFAAGNVAEEDDHADRVFFPEFEESNTETVSSTDGGDVTLEVTTDPDGLDVVLRPVLEALSDLALSEVLGPALRAMGADVAEADLTAWHHDCGRRTIVR